MQRRGNKKKVYILARQTLWINSRIFKQAKSLVEAGYEVKMVGIRRGELGLYEEKDGYTIIRVTPNPVQVRIKEFFRRHRTLQGKPASLPRSPTLRRIVKSSFRINHFLYLAFIRLISNLRWIFNSWDYYSKAYRVVMSDSERPDIIHATDVNTLAVACLLAFRLRAKLVYDTMDLYTDVPTFARWYKVLLSIQEFLLLRLTDKITVSSEFYAQEMERRYKIKVDEVILNCPWYEENVCQAGTISVRSKLNLAEGVPVYLFRGNLTRWKGIENTILALKHLPNGVLVILGEGQLKEKLVELIEREHLEDRVYFNDFVPYTEIPKFISSANVGIVANQKASINHYLSGPSKLFDYIMAELPVVCSDFPFLRKVVLGDGLGATFDPTDPKSIAQAIESVAFNKQRYQQIKRNLLEAKRKYCWENEEKKFLQIYSSLNIREKGCS